MESLRPCPPPRPRNGEGLSWNLLKIAFPRFLGNTTSLLLSQSLLLPDSNLFIFVAVSALWACLVHPDFLEPNASSHTK
jgi:hypothetical protein